eukprot:TRINITY_DN27007_c0_g1_i1.p1 TRINITY_DN27007_c0_g1~~TRINITY_DN27007_c0_g1_i1.p1  ORF type:complete len:608 (+),score=192.47 TRINITY_DN27007_c0_g1_i1:124-1947(+)
MAARAASSLFRRSVNRHAFRISYTQRCFKSTGEDKPSFARGLFFGKVQAEQAFPYPNVLTEDELETTNMLINPIERFMDEKVDSRKIDTDAKIPPEVLDGLKELGLFGLQIPIDLGGLGLSNSAYARVAEEVCKDGSIAVTLLAHQSIGLKGILLNGNDAQKEKYLPKLATGENIAAFALTEPSSGSDAASIRTKATLNEAGTHFLLNGEKIWISNGGIAEVFTVFARTNVDGEDKITAFIVERSFGGLTSGKPEDKLGIRGSNTCAIAFEDCPVPVENVLGGVGEGFKVAMNILNNGRFGLGAGSASQLRRMIKEVAEHATTRQQFGKNLAEFPLIKEKFAQMALDAYACESIAYMTTGMIDRGDPDCYVEAAICKVAGSEAAFRGINECIQVMGGMGFMKDYPYELGLRDSRILSIFEGTNEILRMLIALSGIRGVGDNLKELAKAASNPLANPGAVLSAITSRLFGGMAKGEAISGVHPKLKDCSKQLDGHTKAFGRAVEAAVMKYKKDIVMEQLPLKRIADCTIDLYCMAAVLSRATNALNEGTASAEHEAKLARAFCNAATRRIEANLAGLKSSNNDDELLTGIADDIFAEKNYIPPHPLRV